MDPKTNTENWDWWLVEEPIALLFCLNIAKVLGWIVDECTFAFTFITTMAIFSNYIKYLLSANGVSGHQYPQSINLSKHLLIETLCQKDIMLSPGGYLDEAKPPVYSYGHLHGISK